LLEKVTLSPAMGLYLSMMRNNKPDITTGIHADENYARETMQLFSIGLVKLNQDGTVQTDSSGRGIATYSQADVENLARVFTGWGSNPVNNTGENAWVFDTDYINPMVAYANHHDTGAKTIVGNIVVPAGGTAASELKLALDTLFNHPNVGPFIGKQLIQRLVTSNPSPAYVQRVATTFNNNGQNVRGDLLAVAKAILTDPEAVSAGGNSYGKLREPLLKFTQLWRAFNGYDTNGKVAEYMVIHNSTRYFAQGPLLSPSVFNFFRPDYQRAGALTTAGLVVPEFQTLNESTLVNTSNQLERQAYQFINSQGHSSGDPNFVYTTNNINNNSVMLHTTQWEQYANTPATLIDHLNLVLMSGQMPSAMRQTLIDYVSSVSATTANDTPGSRVAEAASLIINSPQYSIQR
jgi:uncharacterized protein (DUF1800 family)